MGFMKLRTKDIELARDDRYQDPFIATLAQQRWREMMTADPDDLIERFKREAALLGVGFESKPDAGTKLSRMSTTYYATIRLGTNFEGKDAKNQAITLGHELLHARQWRGFGRSKFRTRYMFWPRWRWAIEMQAYRESIRIMLALGYTRDDCERYAISRVSSMLSSYGLGSLRRDDVAEWTRRVLMEVVAG